MKNILFWALGIILFFGVIGKTTSPQAAIQETHAMPNPAVEVTATPTPYIPPTYTPAPTVYIPPVQACSGSAICRDGWCSHSAHRQGTCSSHGGVAQWLN